MKCRVVERYDESCPDPAKHPGYHHAHSVHEVEWALARSETVFDRDGDQVLSVSPSWPNEEGRVDYRYLGGSVSRPIEFLLIPDFQPVTDEELAEVYASLNSGGHA